MKARGGASPSRRWPARRQWLEFKLPDDAEELRLAEHGARFRDACKAVDEKLRAKLKYGDLSEETRLGFQELRDLLWEELRDVPRGEDGCL